MPRGRDKKPRNAIAPRVDKVPRFRDPGIYEGMPLAWRFSSADRSGRWPWNQDVPAEVLHKLSDFEKLPQHELHRAGNLDVALPSLSPEAIQRLVELEYDDLDALFHFRIDGKTRIWCVRDRNIMRVLWYDPEHEVCPSLLRNT